MQSELEYENPTSTYYKSWNYYKIKNKKKGPYEGLNDGICSKSVVRCGRAMSIVRWPVST